ncbi:MAG: V-type ATP synthase subunit I [Planctomycetota bacterium]|jgi:V/A-type H+-transporting ATPase subunit I
MAISPMAKVMIVSHRTEATELLESLQHNGLCQILNAEEAMVSKAWPELGTAAERPREIEELLVRLTKSTAFLKNYSKQTKSLVTSMLSPRTVIDEQSYHKTVADEGILGIIEECEEIEGTIEKLKAESEHLVGIVEMLKPWLALETSVEELGQLKTVKCLTGLLASQKLEEIAEETDRLGAIIEPIGTHNNQQACLVVCLKENAADVQKLLRAAEFETVNLETMVGTTAELIKQNDEELNEIKQQLHIQYEKAASLSDNLLQLEILCDHYGNLLNREQTKSTAPATEQTVILEGWAKEKDYGRLEKIVSGFGASSVTIVEPAEGEEIPVEIENQKAIKPFEVITRLYGMPQHFEVDPTSFLAPFFALFFALCLTDAGYGLVIIGLMFFFIKKMQGDKKLMWMLGICSAVTVVAGALTGGWFGDAIQKFIPALGPLRVKMMWFDPLEKPMTFFILSLALGYIHIQTGLIIAFVHNLRQKNYSGAVFDQLTWLVMLNSIVLFGAGKFGAISGEVGKFFGITALVPAGMIFLFSHREGGWGGRLGMGAYNLFSTIFYMGDVLSYLRLMALGMVTAGLAMAINVIAEIALKIPYGFGYLAAMIVLGFHGFNLVLSGLSAFVHTLRLQYVEFFPKFLAGGGKLFEPLSKKYEHIYISEK